MDYQHLLVTQHESIATVTLNRPEKRNALALGLMRELTNALRTLASGDRKSVV